MWKFGFGKDWEKNMFSCMYYCFYRSFTHTGVAKLYIWTASIHQTDILLGKISLLRVLIVHINHSEQWKSFRLFQVQVGGNEHILKWHMCTTLSCLKIAQNITVYPNYKLQKHPDFQFSHSPWTTHLWLAVVLGNLGLKLWCFIISNLKFCQKSGVCSNQKQKNLHSSVHPWSN